MHAADDDDLLPLLRDAARREGLDHAPPVSSSDPDEIGSYRILRRIGAGGMGIVYEAEQAQPRRRVALKVLDPRLESESAVLRFAHEAEVLGLLDHAGIARILEAGTHDTGRGLQPWFALELVDGCDLDAWVRRERPSRRRRLELFARLCDAVQHAHAKGIVHRDLKPSNVLVTDGDRPKVVDFGVARSLGADVGVTAAVTLAGQVVGTLAYLSPEQLEGDPGAVDTRTDVHGLGLLLFELLSGELPYPVRDRAPAEIVRTLTEQEPRRLGTLDASLRGDLELICSTAIARDKELRYPTAAALGDDVRRYLALEPITARPPSAIYQLGRFARRNRLLVTACLIGVLGLGAGLVAALIQTSRAGEAEVAARNAADRAEEEKRSAQEFARRARAVSDFFARLLVLGDPERTGKPDIAFVEVLDRATAWIEAGEIRDEVIECEVRFALGSAYAGLGRLDAARSHLDRALTLRERHDEETGDRGVLTVLDVLGKVAVSQGDLEAADVLARRSLELRVRLDPDATLEIARGKANIAFVALNRGRADEAEPILIEALELVRSLSGDHATEEVLVAKLGLVNRLRGDLDRAEELLRDAIAIAEDVHGEDSHAVSIRLVDLGSLLGERGRLGEAQGLITRALRIRRERYGPRHAVVSDCLKELGLISLRRGQIDGAASRLEEALSIAREAHGSSSWVVAGLLEKLALVRVRQKRLADAESLYRESLKIATAVLGEGHPDTLITLAALGSLLTDTGRAAEAEPLLSRCLELLPRALPDNRPRLARVRVHHAACLVALGRHEDARRELEIAHRVLHDALGADDPWTRLAAKRLAALAP